MRDGDANEWIEACGSGGGGACCSQAVHATVQAEDSARGGALLDAGRNRALLRREGLYSSNLSAWRKQREAGAFASMSATKRGRQPKLSAQDKELARLRQELERLRKKLGQAEKIIEVQKKLSEVLGVSLDTAEGGNRK